MLYSILAHTTNAYPQNLAVICGDKRYTYIQLKERVDNLAFSLTSLGAGNGDKIAIIHTNCHTFLETYFAAAKIGAILVPVNYRLSQWEYLFILDNSQAKVLIAQPGLISELSEQLDSLPHLEQIVWLDVQEDAIPKDRFYCYDTLVETTCNKDHDPVSLKGSDMAQIYYTSGTTGKAKGVILTHHNNREHAFRAIKELTLTSQDRWLHVSPMFHLADAWAVWAITQVAGVHVMIPSFQPQQVLRSIATHKVTLSNFIPTMLNLLVNEPDIKAYDLSSMRVVLSGGAPIATETIRQVIDVFGCEYIQTYGLTETSPFLTLSKLKPEMNKLSFEDRLKYMATTGRPFCDVKLRVVKENGKDIKSNETEVGEIIAKSDTITPGYWRMPEETSRRIIDGWLYTQDLAIKNSEGYVTIVDRKDDRIVTGGENVYSIEVEDVLYSHPGILEAAVIGLPDAKWGEEVTAVIIPKAGDNLTETDVIGFCRERLASFKVPKKVYFTSSLPKTGSAKIFKYKLREKYTKETENE